MAISSVYLRDTTSSLSDFLSREEILKKLEEKIQKYNVNDKSVPVSIQGPNCTGKSELAHTIASLFSRSFSFIATFNADTKFSLYESYKRVVHQLYINNLKSREFDKEAQPTQSKNDSSSCLCVNSSASDQSFSEVAADLSRAHTNQVQKIGKPSLLIFNHIATNISIPETGAIVIFNTQAEIRCKDITNFKFSMLSAQEILGSFFNIRATSEEISQIAVLLSKHPLFLLLATHYLRETKISVKEYLELIYSCLESSLQQKKNPTDADIIYTNSLKNREFDKEAPRIFCSERMAIAKGQGASENKKYEVQPTQSKIDSSSCLWIQHLVCEMSFFRLSLPAQECLKFCACLHPDYVDMVWIRKWLEKKGKGPLGQMVFIIRELEKFAFVKLIEDMERVTFPRNLQEIVNSINLKTRDASKTFATAISVIEEAAQQALVTDIGPIQDTIVIHGIALINNPLWSEDERAGGALFGYMARQFMYVYKDFKTALVYANGCYSKYAQTYGNESPSALWGNNLLGDCYLALEEYREAYECYINASYIAEKLYLYSHIEKAHALYNIGVSLMGLKNWSKAAECFPKAIEMYQDLSHGSNDPRFIDFYIRNAKGNFQTAKQRAENLQLNTPNQRCYTLYTSQLNLV